MAIYGLTGGIGCGKSTVSAMFAELPSVNVIDTDALAKQIMSETKVIHDIGKICLSQGCDVLSTPDSLDQAKFKEIFFEDRWIKAYVEALVHPLVWKSVDRQVANKPEVIWLIESAIIYELGEEGRFRDIVTVTCSPKVQRRRLKERGYSESEIDVRIASQPASRQNRSSLSIDTNQPIETVRRRVKEIYELIRG